MLKSLIKTNPLILPFYHLVTDDIPFFAQNLYEPRSINQFKKDLDVFLKYYSPISLKELVQINRGESVLDKPSFHLTFDDGLCNFYDIVAPILREKNISATVFLNTHFVDNKDLFFRYKASVLLAYYKKSTPEIRQIFEQCFNGKNVSESLLSINYQSKNVLDEIVQKVDFNFNDFLEINKPYLTLTQIKELEQQGFTFGAHSCDHPMYKNLSLDEQISQTEQSLKWIKDNLNQPNSTFSFPFSDEGVGMKYFDMMKQKMDLSFGISGFKKDAVSTHLHRLDMEKSGGNTEQFLMKEYVKLPLKKMLNKYTLKRN